MAVDGALVTGAFAGEIVTQRAARTGEWDATPARKCERMTEMTMTPEPDAMLRRHALAAALTEAGYPTATATLATMASRGGGPPYRLYGRIPLYRWGDVLAWVESRLTAPRWSTSDGDVQKPR